MDQGLAVQGEQGEQGQQGQVGLHRLVVEVHSLGEEVHTLVL